MRLGNLRIIIPLLLLLSGCKLKEAHEWDVNMLTPIGKGQVSLQNVVNSAQIKADTNSALDFVYVQNLKALGLGDFLKVPDTTVEKTVSLKQISLGQRTMEDNITLGQVARNAGFTGQIILYNQGKEMVIPALSNISTGDVDINATSFFESATFIDGSLKLEIHNGFPVELTEIDFSLRNKTNQEEIVHDTIPSLKPGEYFTQVYSLKNKTVEGRLLAKIINMNSPGSNGQKVLIDTNAAINIKISAYDMQVYKAKAVFPAQNVVDDKAEVPYNLGDAQLVFMRIRSGQIRITTQHTISDSLHLHYTIPYASLNGSSFDVNRIVPPAAPGQFSRVSDTMPINGYEVDLRGKDFDTVNTFYNTLTVRIDSTGKLESLSLQDSIYIYYGLFNIIPEYARGYLGQQNFVIGPESIQMDFFKNIVAGKISLDNVNVNLEIKNGIGVPGEVRIEQLKAVNSRTGKSAILSGEVMSQPISIQPATDNPLQPSVTTLKLDKSNSNIKDLLELLPDKFEYKLNVATNPKGKMGYNDFIYYESNIEANLNIEVPANFGAEGLTLQDTFRIDPKTNLDIQNVKSATFYIQNQNSFPFDVQAQLYILDNNGKITDSLLMAGQNTVLAANVSYPSMQVTVPAESRLLAEVSETQWQKLMSSHTLVLKAVVDTRPGGTRYKIYSNYGLKTDISARFSYRAKL